MIIKVNKDSNPATRRKFAQCYCDAVVINLDFYFLRLFIVILGLKCKIPSVVCLKIQFYTLNTQFDFQHAVKNAPKENIK